jgi:pimeloyl-ACP methyl ester carboxylesterase
VLIHGWSLNLRMWDPQLDDLSRHYQVIRIDRRGFGQSTGDEDVSWDLDDLRRVLDAAGVTRVHVLGMSQGARVALAFALAFPERTRSLILHGSPAPDGFGLPFTGPDRLDQTVFEALAAKSGIDAAKQAWARHPLLAIPAGHPDAERRMAQQLAAYRGGRWLNPKPPSGPTKAASMTDLAAIRVPTLVLVGEREVPYLRIVADALTYGIAGARKVVIPTGGHMVNLVEPALYNRAVIDFLRGVRP